MSIISHNQPEKAEQKSGVTFQGQNEYKTNQVKQGPKSKKAKEKTKKKKGGYQGQRDRRGQPENRSPTTTRTNAVPATTMGRSGQKKRKTWEISKIICYNCNKKDYYASNCTKPKNSM